MAGLSTYLENQIITHLLRTGTWTKPTTVAVALFTAAPTDAGGGTEVTGGSYARVSVNPLDANWGAASASGGSSTSSNLGTVTFPSPTGNWGLITHFALFDNTTAGNLLIWAALTTSKTVNNGDTAPSFAIGALVASLT